VPPPLIIAYIASAPHPFHACWAPAGRTNARAMHYNFMRSTFSVPVANNPTITTTTTRPSYILDFVKLFIRGAALSSRLSSFLHINCRPVGNYCIGYNNNIIHTRTGHALYSSVIEEHIIVTAFNTSPES